MHRRIVTDLLEAVARRDKVTATALCVPGVRYEVMAFECYEGHEGICQFIDDQNALFDGLHTEVLRVIGDRDEIAVERMDTVFVNDGSVQLPTASIFTLVGDKVASWRDYQDLREIARALGYWGE